MYWMQKNTKSNTFGSNFWHHKVVFICLQKRVQTCLQTHTMRSNQYYRQRAKHKLIHCKGPPFLHRDRWLIQTTVVRIVEGVEVFLMFCDLDSNTASTCYQAAWSSLFRSFLQTRWLGKWGQACVPRCPSAPFPPLTSKTASIRWH